MWEINSKPDSKCQNWNTAANKSIKMTEKLKKDGINFPKLL